ncbi:MAG: hypothetical protein O4751_06025 [Trichodesmium sp. St2_bin6]|nr:hypothetical protein [Trichodesmium sp. St2_bin6]MDE5104574.1 hypothetical protein [Trichodesmium sp. St19_bin2]
MVVYIVRGVSGIPLPLFSGEIGKISSNNFHSMSLNPSNLPDIFFQLTILSNAYHSIIILLLVG